ncbi:peptide-methionine (S)-S-oxide reductase MsrA [Pseudomonas sp. dw_358]|uniref:peptide-methionine (S)-S-oxide reductase MsrA n=1 Tax=Pseudomonas sp. dw_358 TaxID=2720083 RepID=UPI001BD3AFBD|nr:peptide-methionine (S)-S-oxide reductase MsrA [Pseudomonas sp. dw_358]
MIKTGWTSALMALAVGICASCAQAAGEVFVIPAPTVDEPVTTAHTETAVFAGGCFWGVQGVYQHVKGVSQAVSGYTGGQPQTAHYEQVGEGGTGHAESVQVTFDPSQVSYGQLLQIYFSVVHDPTERDRQGPDSGSQYRSTVFAQTPEQHQVAQAYISQLNGTGVYSKPLATTIEDNKTFYPAEGYHQNYLTLHPDAPYIAINDQPKVANLAKVFASHYEQKPVLVKE